MNYVKGDLLSVKYGIIAHGCNAQGVMGSGVALAIRNMYPGAYDMYRKAHSLNLGDCIWYRHTQPNEQDLYIANLITQEFYGKDGKRYVSYDAVYTSFKNMLKSSANLPVAIPKIGAGLGGGDWNEIVRCIEAACEDTGYNSSNITVYEK